MEGAKRIFVNLLVELDLYDDYCFLLWTQGERSIHDITISLPASWWIREGITPPSDSVDVWAVADRKWMEALEEYYELKI